MGPSLAARRESADVCLLAEITGFAPVRTTVAVRQILKGKDFLAAHGRAKSAAEQQLAIAADELPSGSCRRGDLVIVFGRRGENDENESSTNGGDLVWFAVRVNETSAAYFVRTPTLRDPAAQRLTYFIRYLEHPDPLIAEDAYLEFAAAPFDTVAGVGSQIPMSAVRDWVAGNHVSEARQGLYGLLLGLARESDRAANRALLEQIVSQRASVSDRDAGGRDFRAGFDGLLGGYLALAGSEALDQIDRQFLLNDDAAEGNLRHAVTALRFAHEYLHQIPRERLGGSMRLLLRRPPFAAAAITDLARWRDENALDEIVTLYEKPGSQQPAIRRAVVGYLLSFDDARSQSALTALRQRDPQGVQAAEKYHREFPGFGAAGSQR